jgi:nucleotide-binding universal stress UspA family protein
MAKSKGILVAVDGSKQSDRAVRYALELMENGLGGPLHLINVQPSLRGAVTAFISKDQVDSYHRDEGNKALASAVAIVKKASTKADVHIGVGRHGEVVAEFAKKLKAGLVVVGTRGHTGLAGVLLGSVAQDIIAHTDVPVMLVK